MAAKIQVTPKLVRTIKELEALVRGDVIEFDPHQDLALLDIAVVESRLITGADDDYLIAMRDNSRPQKIHHLYTTKKHLMPTETRRIKFVGPPNITEVDEVDNREKYHEIDSMLKVRGY